MADVTNSDVDTQVVLDLVKARTDLDGLSRQEISSTFCLLTVRPVAAYSHARHGHSANMS
jgi:hypothetical protein